MADADEQARLKAERIKAMLSGYYGVGGGSAGGAAPGSATKQPDAASAGGRGPGGQPGVAAPRPNLDSAGFDAQQHIASLLRSHPLEKLLVEHRGMSREIKSLDSDMQQLVYENYNKFISATDTIRSMKSNVDSMGTDMERLKSIMDNVADKTNAVCDKLHKRSETMEELQKVQGLLKKLQAVFDLPKKMRAALEGDMLDTAVSFYAEAQPLLNKYGSRGTFKQITAEANLVAKEISQILKKRLTERKDSEEQCVLLLRKLGEPDDTLQDKYLQGRANRLRRIMREAAVVADAMAVAASAAAAAAGAATGPAAAAAAAAAVATGPGGSSAGTVPLDALLSRGVESPATWGFVPAAGAAGAGATGGAGKGHGGPGGAASGGGQQALHAPNIRQFVRLLDEKVINAMQETVVNVLRFFLQGDAQSPAKRKALVALAREVFGEYFKVVRRALSDASAVAVHRAALLAAGAEATARVAAGGSEFEAGSGGSEGRHLEFGADWGAEGLVQALSTLSADLGLLHSHLPELSLRDRAAAMVSGAIQRHLAASFGAVSARVLAGVCAVRSRLESPGGVGQEEQLLRKGYAYCATVLRLSLASCMDGLKPFDTQPAIRLLGAWRDGYCDAVQGLVQRLFLALLGAFMEMARIRYDGSDLLRAALKPSSASSSSVSAPSTPSPLSSPAPGSDPSRTGGEPSSSADASAAVSAFSETSEALSLPGTSHYSPYLIPSPQAIPPSASSASSSASASPPSGPAPDPKTGLVLLLAKLCTLLEQQSVPWVMEALAASPTLSQQQRFAAAASGPGGGPTQGPSSGGQGAGDLSLLPPAFVPGEVARRLSAAGSALLGYYVELHGRQLSLMVRRSVASTNWLNHKEPRGPRPVCDLCLERLGRAEAEVLQLVEESGRGRADERKAGAPGGARGGGGALDANLALETGNVERNLAKIFRTKVKAFGTVPFTQAGILSHISGVGLKSLVECVRLEALGRQGLQQLQIDCHYLRPPMRRLTGGATAQVVDSLLDEVVSAGVERSTDPSLLEPPVLDRILANMDTSV